MANQMVVKPVTRNRRPQRRSAIRILEEAVHLLRRAPGHLFAYYYTGSLPFILGMLYFWGDMSRKAYATDYNAIASLGMALLFIWMKSWQAIFAIRIKAIIVNQPEYRVSWHRIFALVANQALIHASGFLLLPLAALVMLPFGWCYAFYQNATVLADRQSQDLSSLSQRSWQQAKMWPNQNHILLGVFFVFGIIVFLNLAITLFILPYMLKKFFGFESIFTMSGINSLNTTFLATTIGLTYLCMDPVVKTAYILRCYYGEALKSGADIKNQLNRLVRQGTPVVTVLFLILVLWPSAGFTSAQHEVATGAAETGANTVSVEDLDHSIEQVLSQREFAWRLARERLTEEDLEKSGPVATAVKWVWRKLGQGLKTLWRWLKTIFEWLVDLLPKRDPDKNVSDTDWQISVRGLLIALLVLSAGVTIYLFWRIWQRRRIKPETMESETVSLVPDLTDDGLKADELPADRWLAMARELWAQGSVRLAMRALYLATLAHLGEHDLINIEGYKSNLDYKRELQHRAHDNPELLTAFSTVVTLLEKVWFGMHKISQPEVDTFTKNQKRIMTFAEE
jgi:hypothetical protein